MSRSNNGKPPLQRTLWVVFIYLLIGGAWISLSDALLARWISDPELLTRAQTWKGWGFILATGLALFGTLYRQFSRDREMMRRGEEQTTRIHDLSQFREGVIDNANVWINVLDSSGCVVLWNKAAERISGYSRDEVVGREDVWQWLYPDPAYREEIRKAAEEVLSEGRVLEAFETWIITRAGQERLIEWSSRRLFDDEGRLVGSIAIGSDVTRRRQAERALKRREQQLATLMDNLPGMAYRCLYDQHWTMKFVSSGCYELTGFTPGELVDNRDVAFAELIHSDDPEGLLRSVEEAIGSAETFSIEYQLIRKDGERIWVWERGRASDAHSGLTLEGIILDITDRKMLEQELAKLATRDALTGLYNRRETSRILQEEIDRASRYDHFLAILWIDLDHFKSVNDRYGHSVGDRILRALCERLSCSIRNVDTMGRYGGEEFMILLPEMSSQDAMDTAERLRKLIADEPVVASDSLSLDLTISIGVAVFPEHGRRADTLCRAADRAMYRAKARGRNQVCLASGQPAGESP
ncbi:diguanylate cyclase [Marinobacter sp.]|uniref:sensor domain-containing diguanylate cyclase n=1 Tax=Marinobacter sp. TaxID=50741 RepID=UPI00384A83A5